MARHAQAARALGIVVAATLALSLVLVGTGRVATVRASGDARYVALGDSYTAGPLIPHQVPDPPGCGRSTNNYPRLTAAALGAVLHDVSCSGATTRDMTSPQLVVGGVNPPQLDALRPDTTLVSLGISGNDIGFAGLVATCVSPTPLGSPCRDRYAGAGGDEISRRVADAGLRVAAVLHEIRRRSPAATVYVVGYPAILPDTGFGCWPLMPISYADVPYLRDKEKELNAMLAGRAAAAGAVYVDTYAPSVGHDACTLPLVRWVEPVVPLSPAAPVHPNAHGMRGMADAVVRAVATSEGAGVLHR